MRECRCAASAPAISIQCISRPPSSAPRGLASLGRTNSFISEMDSRTGRGIGGSWVSFMFVVDRILSKSISRRVREFARVFKVFFVPDTTAKNTRPASAREPPDVPVSNRQAPGHIRAIRFQPAGVQFPSRSVARPGTQNREPRRSELHRTNVPSGIAGTLSRIPCCTIPAPERPASAPRVPARCRFPATLPLAADAPDVAVQCHGLVQSEKNRDRAKFLVVVLMILPTMLWKI